MARERGTFNFSASLEVKKQGALDSRLVVQTYEELKSAATWADTDGKVWLYDGMIVSIVADESKNGVYMLTDKDQYQLDASWTRIDAASAEKVQVIDNLTSDSTTAALSAKQGKVLDGKITDIIESKGQANGIASLDENGKIPASQLNGDLGRVVGIEKFLNTQAELGTDPDASTAEEGEKYFCKDVNKVFTKTSDGWDEGVEPKGNTIYNHRLEDAQGRTNVLYRWDGSTMVEISASLALGETEGTAYEGSKGKALSDKVTALDTAVSAVKNKTVGTSISGSGTDTELPTTKAVVDYLTKSTNGVAKSMSYAQKSGDASKMELKLLAVDGSTLSTIEMDKEKFITKFEKKTAEEGDVTEGIELGDPLLVITMTDGQQFKVSLKSLVDVYTGQATNSINTTVSGNIVKADLKLDSATQNNSPVKLTVGSNGLSADLSINTSANGTKGVTLTKTGEGLAAELKIDEASNTANGVSMSVGANGVSVGIVWTEI